MSIKFAILGSSGNRGKELYRLFSRPGCGTEIVATADSDAEAQKIFASNAEAIVISTPDYLHEEHACAALYAGKHVYLEKPMAITPEGCDRIIEASRQSGRILYVGHNLRHFTVIKKLKTLIDDGRVGEVKAVWCQHPVSYGRWAYYAEGRWHKKRQNTGSLLIHKGSHDLDVIHWLAGGYTKRVVAMGALSVWGNQTGNPDVEDISSVLMLLENGVQATYSQCHFAHLASREYMVVGTKGTLRNIDDNPERAVVQLFEERRKDAKSIPTQEWRFAAEQGFHGNADQRIADEFLGIIRGTAKPTISQEDAVRAVKTAYAATISLRSGNVPIDVV